MEDDVPHVQSQTPPPPIISAATPPLITPPPPPRPPRKGSGWMKVAVVLGILLLLSVLSNLGHLVNSVTVRSEEHTSELQSPCNLVCRLLLEKKKKIKNIMITKNKQNDSQA